MIKNVDFNAVTSAAEVRKYVSPEVKVVIFHHEGILCSSVEGVSHEGFSEGGSYDL